MSEYIDDIKPIMREGFIKTEVYTTLEEGIKPDYDEYPTFRGRKLPLVKILFGRYT